MQRDVVERAMAGDRDAFSELRRGSIDRLYTIAQLILRDGDRAQNATQEAYIAARRPAGPGQVRRVTSTASPPTATKPTPMALTLMRSEVALARSRNDRSRIEFTGHSVLPEKARPR